METWRMKQTQKSIFTIIFRGFVIPVQEWQYIAYFRAYLVAILKALDSTAFPNSTIGCHDFSKKILFCTCISMKYVFNFMQYFGMYISFLNCGEVDEKNGNSSSKIFCEVEESTVQSRFSDNLWLMPYPCSHFYFDINFGDRLYSKEKRRAWPLLFWIYNLLPKLI